MYAVVVGWVWPRGRLGTGAAGPAEREAPGAKPTPRHYQKPKITPDANAHPTAGKQSESHPYQNAYRYSSAIDQ
jgi:hypothetical protein